MIHVGMLKFVPEATEDQMLAIESGFKALVGVIPGLTNLTTARDLGLGQANASLIFAATFASEQAWREYGAHPAHVALIKTHIGPILADKSFVQIKGPFSA